MKVARNMGPSLTFRILLGVGLSSWIAVGESDTLRDEAWDRVFHRTTGWTGGDAMYSVDLGRDRVLWLFADTWVGRVEKGGHAPGSRLVNNTIALHARDRTHQPPTPDAVNFHWGPDSSDGHPTAFFRPDDASTWFWVADGVVALPDTPKESLILFLWLMRRANNPGVFDFQIAGGTLATVARFREDPSRWVTHLHPLPHADPSVEPRTDWTWGCDINRIIENGTEFLFVHGVRQREHRKDMVLARVPSDHLLEWSRWEFRTKEGWSSDRSTACSLHSTIASEYSVSRIHGGQNRDWALIYSHPFLGPDIFMQFGPSLDGPWGPRRKVFTVPEVKDLPKTFTYAAKAHPELSRPGELLVSYVVNSFDFGSMVSNADIYRPRFIRVKLASHGSTTGPTSPTDAEEDRRPDQDP
jgi:hypothetical protein